MVRTQAHVRHRVNGNQRVHFKPGDQFQYCSTPTVAKTVNDTA
jgi:hypothetical protein